jgi:rSAM/selenodomain-associated transferase 1
MSAGSVSLGVFARYPRAGRVKTRLVPPLDGASAARLYGAFVRDLAAALEGVRAARRVLFASGEPGPGDPPWSDLLPSGWEVRPQMGGSLGERLEAAFEELLGTGAALVLGSDSPTLPVEVIGWAAGQLERADLVLGPCTDGGYYLIGMRRLLPQILRGIPWSTDRVLGSTLDIVERSGLVLGGLPPWYDVDTGSDLEFLRAHVRFLALTAGGTRHLRHTRDVLEELETGGLLDRTRGPQPEP